MIGRGVLFVLREGTAGLNSIQEEYLKRVSKKSTQKTIQKTIHRLS